jgi:hypothetical protein
MTNWKRLLVSGVVFFSVCSAQAGVTPLGIAIVHKIEFPPEDFTVTGARVSALWGIHRQVYGFDFGGIGNITEQDFSGLAVSGGFNSNLGDTHVLLLQAAGVANYATAKVSVLGVQVAGIMNYSTGESNVMGVQIAGIANYTPHETVGFLQVGAYNQAHAVYGFQVGVINVCDELHGLQIGLLNFNHKGPFSVAPILNASF